MMAEEKSPAELIGEEVVDVCEGLDWDLDVCMYGDDTLGIELEKHSPAGEDFVFNVPADGFARNIRAYADEFDAEEHAEMWIEMRGKRKVPSSIRTLLDDANSIKAMLLELADALEPGSGTVAKDNIPVTRMLKVSTVNLSKATAELLWAGKINLSAFPKQYPDGDIPGYFVCCCEWDDDPETTTVIPEDLKTVLKYAVEHGCEWIMFDRNEEVCELLPRYQWESTNP